MSMLLRHLVVIAGLAAICSPVAAQAPRAGTYVFAYWEADGFWYPAEVEEVDGEQVHVHFLDDDARKWLPIGQVGRYEVDVGDAVEANWQNGGKYYPGTIADRDGDRYYVQYDDGDEERVDVRQLRVSLHTSEGFQPGQLVFAWWSSDGYWYPGRIDRIEDGRYRIRFDDGDTDWLSDGEVSTYAVQPGEWVEVSQAPKKRFYSALVTSRRGRTLYVEYEDGSTGEADISRVRANLGSP